MRYLPLLTAVLLMACYDPKKAVPIDPVYPPPAPWLGDIDAGCGGACANLRRLECPEGFGAITGETCERRCAIGIEMRPLPLACWIAADDVIAAKSCGALRCVH